MAFGNSSQDNGGMMSEINVTPLVDVMLVLLVVFIITAPLLAQSLKINLPETESVAKDDKLQKFCLVIDAQGGISFENAHLSDDGLAEMLKRRAADPGFKLQIQADEAVNYGRVAQVMAIAQKAGVSKLFFLTIAGP